MGIGEPEVKDIRVLLYNLLFFKIYFKHYLMNRIVKYPEKTKGKKKSRFDQHY